MAKRQIRGGVPASLRQRVRGPRFDRPLSRSRRPHASLDGITPDQAYFTPLPLRMAAKARERLHLSTRKICSDNRDRLKPQRRRFSKIKASFPGQVHHDNSYLPVMTIL